jgi:hypothetical protein
MARDEALEAALTEGLRYAGMHESQREMVRAYLDAPPDPTQCCGSSCDPCVITIARAVQAARKALGRD